MNWQYLLALTLVVAAAGYLAWSLLRSVKAKNASCGGCSVEQPSGSHRQIIPRDQIRLRRDGGA